MSFSFKKHSTEEKHICLSFRRELLQELHLHFLQNVGVLTGEKFNETQYTHLFCLITEYAETTTFMQSNVIMESTTQAKEMSVNSFLRKYDLLHRCVLIS